MNVFLKYGSHSEKEYFKKTLRFFNGVIFSSNLIEATPAATASLIVKYCLGNLSANYIIDPMTYSFGEYIDPSGQLIQNLQWLKKKGKFKSSYKKLSEKLGSKFSNAVLHKSAIKLSDLEDNGICKSICKDTIKYQNERVKDILREDEEYADFADDLPSPFLVYSPYFYIDKNRKKRWLDVYQKICSNSLEHTNNLYLKLCFDYNLLADEEFIASVPDLVQQGLKGVCLWASKFDEQKVDIEYLIGFRTLVEKLKEKNVNVFNRHGSYFSYILSKYGLTETSYSVGYGSNKDVIPVVGGGTPTVNFYYPNLHGKFSVPKIERTFIDIGVNNANDFFEKICNCVICKGVIKNDLKKFRAFGEFRYSNPNSKRTSQVPAAAKISRFHYLLSRITEKNHVENTELKELLAELTEAQKISNLPVFGRESEYIEKWRKALDNASS